MDDKISISVLIFFLLMESLFCLNGCDRHGPSSKALKELQRTPNTAVGGVAGNAIDNAKGVEPKLGEASNRTAETSKEKPS